MTQDFSNLTEYQAHHVPLLLASMETFLDRKLAEAQEKDAVQVEITEVIKEFVMRGGKRIRPLLTVLAHQYATQLRTTPQTGDIYQAAGAVELLHLYILNLDDMADRDVLRHGGPTLEEYYKTQVFANWKDADHHGRTLSSIAGALLNSFASEMLMTSGCDAQALVQANLTFSKSLMQDTVLGWQIHYFQNNQSLSQATQEQFLKGLEYVTSRYTFVGPMKIGLQLTNDEEVLRQLEPIFTEYGRCLGIAFQIYDDILGLFGDTRETGKAVGNDVREGKKTLLIQEAFARGSHEEKEFLQQIIATQLSETELQEVKEIVKKTGALEHSQDLAQQYVKKGIQVLDQLPKQTVEIQVLRELAEYIVNRKK